MNPPIATLEDAERPDGGASLAESERRFRGFAESSSDVIFIADRECGRLLQVNAAYEILWGHPAAALFRDFLNYRATIHPEDRESVAGAWQVATQEPTVIEHRIVRPDGTVLWIRHRGFPIRDEGGAVAYVAGVAQDITVERQARESTRLSILELQKASRLKDEFLSTLSHELRTPLHAIYGWVQLLRRGGMDGDSLAKAMEVIERNTISQTRIIDDLLDMSRIVSGKLRLELQPISFVQVIDSALATVEPSLRARSLEVVKHYDPAAIAGVGDPHRLQQVVWNLLSNAIKFTPEGGRIDIYLDRVDFGIRLRISDTGQGIAPDFLPFIFDRFEQADAAITRREGGLGLGLAIVKQIVELHGGRIVAESNGAGRGSSLTVTLPAEPPADVSSAPDVHPQESPARGHPLDTPSVAGLVVLFVDDDPDARRLVRTLLERRGVEVLLASSRDEALEILDQRVPAVLVSDIGMPDYDGYDLLRALRERSRERGGRIPAVAVTAFASPDDRRRALEAGFQMHISKPMDIMELLRTVAALTGRA